MNEAVTIRMTDTHVCLRVPFDLTQVCQSLRGRWNPEWKCWLWPKDKQAARRILDAFGPRAARMRPVSAVRPVCPSATASISTQGSSVRAGIGTLASDQTEPAGRHGCPSCGW